MPRIQPLEPPYSAEVRQALSRRMPPQAPYEPLALFRVLQRSPELAARMNPLGSGLLGHGLLPAADRELVIARATALAGCRYEWGVHAATMSQWAGLTPEQLEATVEDHHATGPHWTPRQVALLRAVDELHDTADLTDSAWAALRAHYDDAQLLEFLVLAGWYRTIAGLANALRLEAEPWATPFPAR